MNKHAVWKTVCAATALTATAASPGGAGCPAAEFDAWALEHAHSFASAEERELRRARFCATRATVHAHNAKYKRGESGFFMRLNRFAALSAEEWSGMMGYQQGSLGVAASAAVTRHGDDERSRDNNVSAVDWRAKGKVSSVKNQGQCGSCWAFSAIGAMEGAVSIQQGFAWNASDENSGYSVNQCLECTPNAMGCEGGWPWLCFQHIIDNGGIDSEEDWPYLSSPCDAAKEKLEKVAAISGFKNITDGDESMLQRALAQQPVSVGVRANCDAFRNYGGGVLDEDCGGGEREIDHAILAVGYNLTGKNPYYIVKNSWGTSWGEDGYLRMQIGNNLDCIACKATYPVAAKEQPPQPPVPELKCPTGTFDPSLKEPATCPKGSSCCCARNKFWKKDECKETACCLEDEVCVNKGFKHGCQKKSELPPM